LIRYKQMVRLSSDNIHIWYAKLDQPRPHIKELEQTLSINELMRAKRFRFERDRRRFTVGRGILRKLLGLYSDIEPGQLRFHYGPYGKPYLIFEGDGAKQVRFNLAHSHELAIYAFILDRRIGVDLEYVRDMPDIDQIAAAFFSATENTMLSELPKDQKQEAFFNCWTRKEAYIKAIGNGLSHPLDQFDVSMIPGEPARLLKIAGAPKEASRWSLKALSPAPGYAAAIAVEGHDWKIQNWHYDRLMNLQEASFENPI